MSAEISHNNSEKARRCGGGSSDGGGSDGGGSDGGSSDGGSSSVVTLA